MAQKEKMLNLRVTEDLIDRLNRASAVLDVPYAQFVREAIKEKLEELAASHPELREQEEPAAA